MMERFRAFWGHVFTPVARLFLRLGSGPDAVTVPTVSAFEPLAE